MADPLIVLKFGGTALGSARRIRTADPAVAPGLETDRAWGAGNLECFDPGTLIAPETSITAAAS